VRGCDRVAAKRQAFCDFLMPTGGEKRVIFCDFTCSYISYLKKPDM